MGLARAATLHGLTIREAARRLGRPPERVRGSIDAMRLELHPIGNALVMSEEDFQRLRECLEAVPAADLRASPVDIRPQ